MTRLALCLSFPCVLLLWIPSCTRTSTDPASQGQVGSEDRQKVYEKAEDLPLEIRLSAGSEDKPSSVAARTSEERRNDRSGVRRRYGMGPDSAVDLNLDWLAKHQTHDEGYWDSDGFQKQCYKNPCDGKGDGRIDPVLTGLGYLAFLGAGYSPYSGLYRKTLRDALNYLKRLQDEEGCFGPRKGLCLYTHAVCTLALAETYVLTGNEFLRKPLEKAVAFLLASRIESPASAGPQGWGVLPGDSKEIRLEVTVWAILALWSARDAGLAVPQATLDGIKVWLHSLIDPATGVIRSLPARSKDILPHTSTEACTAMGILMHHLLGEDPEKNACLEKGTDYLVSRLPALQETLDPVTWYFGTLALFHTGGQPWKAWDRAIKETMIDALCRTGCEEGSWKGRGAWDAFGGRIFTTALLAMATQVYHRYGKVAGTRFGGGALKRDGQDDPEAIGFAILANPGGPGISMGMERTSILANAVLYLERIQDREGCLVPRKGPYLYTHAICTLALAETYMLTRSPLSRRPLEKAVAFLLESQNRDPITSARLGWGPLPGTGGNRIEVTVWAMMALRSTKDTGLTVPQGALDGIRTWLHTLIDPATGIVRSPPGRPRRLLPDAPPEACTAMGVVMRLLFGEDPEQSASLKKGMTFLLSRAQDRNGSLDPITWHFGTLALFHAGGKPWKAWSLAFGQAVLDARGKSRWNWDGNARGAWGTFGGHIHGSALLDMAARVHFGYDNVAGIRYLSGSPGQK